MPLALASASVKPHQATSGSVKTTAGMMIFCERAVLADDDFDRDARLPWYALCASKMPPAMSPMA